MQLRQKYLYLLNIIHCKRIVTTLYWSDEHRKCNSLTFDANEIKYNLYWLTH
jgi:hypothetical protein